MMAIKVGHDGISRLNHFFSGTSLYQQCRRGISQRRRDPARSPSATPSYTPLDLVSGDYTAVMQNVLSSRINDGPVGEKSETSTNFTWQRCCLLAHPNAIHDVTKRDRNIIPPRDVGKSNGSVQSFPARLNRTGASHLGGPLLAQRLLLAKGAMSHSVADAVHGSRQLQFVLEPTVNHNDLLGDVRHAFRLLLGCESSFVPVENLIRTYTPSSPSDDLVDPRMNRMPCLFPYFPAGIWNAIRRRRAASKNGHNYRSTEPTIEAVTVEDLAYALAPQVLRVVTRSAVLEQYPENALCTIPTLDALLIVGTVERVSWRGQRKLYAVCCPAWSWDGQCLTHVKHSGSGEGKGFSARRNSAAGLLEPDSAEAGSRPVEADSIREFILVPLLRSDELWGHVEPHITASLQRGSMWRNCGITPATARSTLADMNVVAMPHISTAQLDAMDDVVSRSKYVGPSSSTEEKRRREEKGIEQQVVWRAAQRVAQKLEKGHGGEGVVVVQEEASSSLGWGKGESTHDDPTRDGRRTQGDNAKTGSPTLSEAIEDALDELHGLDVGGGGHTHPDGNEPKSLLLQPTVLLSKRRSGVMQFLPHRSTYPHR